MANYAGIQEIEPFTFKNCKFMNILQLKGNSIQICQKNTFSGMRNLMSLNLLENDCEILEAGCFEDCDVRKIFVSGNKFKVN